MQKHASRLIVAAVLIAAAVTGGFFVFALHQRAAAIDADARDVASRIDRMIATAGDIASAQQAYVAPGQPDQPWRERAAMLLQQFGEDAAAIHSRLRSTGAAAALDDVDRSFKAIVLLDSKARQELGESQYLLAADLIFSEGHDAIGMLITTLRGLSASERQTADAMHASVEQQEWSIVAGLALMWGMGLAMLVRVPAPGLGARDSGLANPEPAAVEQPNHETSHPELANPRAVDLSAAAEVCSALARVTDAAALSAVLGRACEVLDACGIIIWMGAGEQLFPVLSCGYDDRIVARLGPIPRNAANATAEAWRTLELRTVAGDVMSNGAVAAPVTGVSGCVGVLAAELRHGREADPAARAVAAMIAAQLAGIIAAWPAASGQPQHKTA